MLNWLKSFMKTRLKGISLVSNWMVNQLWMIETRFLSLAREAYGGNEVVYACLRVLSQGVPEPPLIAYELGTNTRTVLDLEHPLVKLIRDPNELMTEFEFMELTTLQLSISGRSTWWKERNNVGQIIALWPLRPDRVGPIYSNSSVEGQRVLSGWSYVPPDGKEPIPIPRGDVVAFNYPDPAGESGGIVEGLGSLEVLARQISSDNEATKFVGSLLANYAAPTIALQVKRDINDKETLELIKAQFRHEFGGANRGIPAVLAGETEIKTIGFNLRELEFPDLRNVSETRICAALGVPAILAHLQAGLKASTYSNVEQARLYFAETTLSSIWRRFQDQWTKDIASEFGDNIICEFDTFRVRALAAKQEATLKPVENGFRQGVITVNEYRKALGYNPVPDEVGNVFLLQGNIQIVSAEHAPEEPIEEPIEEPVEAIGSTGGEAKMITGYRGYQGDFAYKDGDLLTDPNPVALSLRPFHGAMKVYVPQGIGLRNNGDLILSPGSIFKVSDGALYVSS